MSIEELKEILLKDIDSYGKPRHIVKSLRRIKEIYDREK